METTSPRHLRADGRSSGGVANAWEKFLQGEQLPSGAVRRMIEDSWRRSIDRGVDPGARAAPMAFKGDDLYSLQSRHVEMIEAARPVLDQAREFLLESGTVMVLTDPKGVILAIEGDASIKDYGTDIHLIPGGMWAETFTGTNAVGTALATGLPVQICAHEHFCEEIQRWTCSASVIRDPYEGNVLGVLDVSGLNGNHHTHCLALAVSGAGRIESRLAGMEMEKRARLLDLTSNNTARWANNGLVIFDRRGRLVRANERAGDFFDNMGLDNTVLGQLSLGRRADKSDQVPDALPHWLKKDWLEPIIEKNERLGTVLVLPTSARKAYHTGSVERLDVKADVGTRMSEIIGESPILLKAKKRATHLAKLSVPVLLLGPTGAGKEVFARALHNSGPNPSGPFVPLNCGGMTRDLLASELFGYVEGAFTGARRGGQVGKFEAANGGTLFLDEIGEMPMELQPHFLRVLEEGEVYRLGENKPRKVNIRLVAATNRDLRAEVAAGNFRMDLFYRLAVTVLHLPGLAEHREDVPLLARHFADQTAKRYGVPAKYPPPDVMEALMAYSWPGNVRELRNVVESMVLLSEEPQLSMDDVPPEIASRGTGSSYSPMYPPSLTAPVQAPQPAEGGGKLADSERNAIITAIRAEAGNLTRAAERLGIAKSTLYEKMKRYGLDRQSTRG